jgi:hypothetical protein
MGFKRYWFGEKENTSHPTILFTLQDSLIAFVSNSHSPRGRTIRVITESKAFALVLTASL